MSTQNGSFAFNKGDLKLYVDPSNPRGYDNQFIYDLSYNKGFTFSMDNGATFSLSNNKVFQLDGVTSTTASVVMANNIYTMVPQMTWDVWFKRTNTGNTFNMVYSHFVPYLGFRGPGINKFEFSWYTKIGGVNTLRSLLSNITYSNNVWYNVTCTLDQNVSSGSSTAQMYINGSFATSSTITSSVDTVYQPNDKLYIGNYRIVKYPFTGNIGPLRIWHRILSSDEILQSYNSLKSRYGY
jgi:hypothetical protein